MQKVEQTIDTLLAASFKTLAEKKPIEKITIKEITDRAGVIRPTFYNHFQDKYELLEWIVHTELIEPMRPLFEEGELKAAATGSLLRMRKEKGFYTRAVKLTGQNSFTDTLKAELSAFILSYLDEELLKKKLLYDWLTPKRSIDFYSEQIVYAIIEWINDDMRVSEEELVDIFIYVSTHSVAELLAKMQ